MRWHIGMFLVLAVVFAAYAHAEESVQELVARADAAPSGEKPGLYIKAAELELKNADHLYDENKVDEAAAHVKDLLIYADKAVDASTQTGSRLKNTEITLRKISTRLRDIQRNVSFEDQAPIKAATDHLEDLRSTLLSHMFSKRKKK